MSGILSTFWSNVVGPLLQRPKRLQVAALCYRQKGDTVEILLVTSRDTGRWILPKGWPIRGLNFPEAALQEAWEEAGVRNSAALSASIGSYTYYKKLKAGFAVPVETYVYTVPVEDLASKYPEAHERKRKWVSPDVAANLVNETELKQLLRNFTQKTSSLLA